MHLELHIVIRRRPADILRFPGTVDNVVKWDRGVVRTVITKTTLRELLRGLGRYDSPIVVGAFDQGGGR